MQELEERKKEAEERKKEAAELKMLLEIAKKGAGTAESTAKKAEDELKKARRRNLPVSESRSDSFPPPGAQQPPGRAAGQGSFAEGRALA